MARVGRRKPNNRRQRRCPAPRHRLPEAKVAVAVIKAKVVEVAKGVAGEAKVVAAKDRRRKAAALHCRCKRRSSRTIPAPLQRPFDQY